MFAKVPLCEPVVKQGKRIADGGRESTEPAYSGGAVEGHITQDMDLPKAA